MNKIVKVIGVLLIVFLSVPVFAKTADNKLYFKDSGKRLYYDTKLFDESVFMYHDGITPGVIYTDKLLIENGSKTDYNLFLKIKEITQDNDDANELLDNISMKIYLDKELIYDGKVKGLDYNNVGVNIQDAIHIGEYKVKTEKELIVETQLNEDYVISNEKEVTSNIDWEFYASYDDAINDGNDDNDKDKDNIKEDENKKPTEVIPINPNTNDNISMYVGIAILSAISIIILALFLTKKKKLS